MTSSEEHVLAELASAGVVPVTTVQNADQVHETCQALLRGGVTCIEIAFRSPAATAALAQACEVDGMVVGAGTILSPEQAHAAAEAGAKFAVAPGTNDEVVRTCQQLGLPFFPGVATPSEIEHARALGLTTVKVFPASNLGGTTFLRAVSATYPDVGFIPTGG
ncbi:MAG: bifunctional 4-hydroxy-2-oxoglutarate aldolase/2-dehydro-3-deoxy-phosphogluconate aldolase, partial [Gaiellaceae bacterium]